MTLDISNEDAMIDEIVERLSTRFPTRTPEEVREVVSEAYEAFAGAPVRDFVAVLAEKQAKKRLKQFDN